MHCANCAASIEKGLAAQTGVECASVNFAAEELTVFHDRMQPVVTGYQGKGYYVGMVGDGINDVMAFHPCRRQPTRFR